MASKTQTSTSLVPTNGGRRRRGGALATKERTRTAEIEAIARPAAVLNAMTAQVQTAAIQSAAESAMQAQDRLKKLYDSAKDKTSRTHKATVDLGGSMVGILSFEGLNWMVRWMGEKFPAIGESVDYWQSIPHLVIGICAYWGELLTRKKASKDGGPAWPSMPREIASEWAKVFILLGAANLARALRVRRRDAKQAAERLVDAESEVAKLKAQLADLQKK